MRNFFLIVIFILFISKQAQADTDESSTWKKWLGTAAPSSFYLGMWTYHLDPNSNTRNNIKNNLIGINYKGWLVGTFTNSYGVTSYAAGIQRYWISKSINQNLVYDFGYRLGLIYGYDHRLMPLANTLRFLPFPQLISSFTWKHFGWEISYTGIVVSTELFYRF